MNVTDIANGIGDKLTNGARWLVSLLPGRNYTPVEVEKESGVNVNSPLSTLPEPLQQVASGNINGAFVFLLVFVVVYKIIR